VTGPLKQFYDSRQWFDLRIAIGSYKAPPLYAGVIAAAFNNDERARMYLNKAIRTNSSVATVKEAREILAHLYAREGLYKETIEQLDGIQRIEPNRDTENTRALFAQWSSHPDQSISSVKPSTIHADVRRNGVRLPVIVHGKTLHWLLDTGANFSFISEVEARALGIAIDENAVNIADPAGGTARVRTAVADELAIGDVHIRNAGFLVLPDTQEPMSDWQPGERGVIGLPLVIALQLIDWRSDGRFQIRGPHGPTNGKQNLCFDGFYLVTRTKFHEQDSGGTDLDFVLDTGDQSNTQLWRRFGAEFAYLLKKRGMPRRERITTVGGSNVRETVRLPELLLQVGVSKRGFVPPASMRSPLATRPIMAYSAWTC
jgi:hypothetical protein